MTEQHTAAVSAYNDWDPLKEIIVGVADGSVESAYEPALAPFYARETPAGPAVGDLIRRLQ